jgi:transcriptional regulator with XRE-family HTH domain
MFQGVIEEASVDQERKREIGRRVKRLRERSPHTQESLADLLGMTLRGYQKAELTGSISYTKLEKLAEIHRVAEGVDWFYLPADAAPDESQLDRIEAKLDDILSRLDLLLPESELQRIAVQAAKRAAQGTAKGKRESVSARAAKKKQGAAG